MKNVPRLQPGADVTGESLDGMTQAIHELQRLAITRVEYPLRLTDGTLSSGATGGGSSPATPTSELKVTIPPTDPLSVMQLVRPTPVANTWIAVTPEDNRVAIERLVIVPDGSLSGGTVDAKTLLQGIHKVGITDPPAPESPVRKGDRLVPAGGVRPLAGSVKTGVVMILAEPRTLHIVDDVDSNGSTAYYAIVLNAPPAADTTVVITPSADVSTVAFTPTSITFTPANWQTPQTICVNSTSGGHAHDFEMATIRHAVVSADAVYSRKTVPDISLDILDASEYPIVFGATNPYSGVYLAETNGTKSIAFRPRVNPEDSVIIRITPTDPRIILDGGTAGAYKEFTFTSGNWGTPQTVVLTVAADSVSTAPLVASRLLFSMAGVFDISVVVGEKTPTFAAARGTLTRGQMGSLVCLDRANIMVEPTTLNVLANNVADAKFTMAMNSKPTANVVVTPTSGDPAHVTFTPASQTFTPANWATPLSFAVKADQASATPVTITLAVTSADPDYNGLAISSVSISPTVYANAVLDHTGIAVVEGDSGNTGTFTVKLTEASRPGEVELKLLLLSNNPDVTLSSATALPEAWNVATAYVTSNIVSFGGLSYRCLQGHTGKTPPNPEYWEQYCLLIFTNANYATAQTVTVTAPTTGKRLNNLITALVRFEGLTIPTVSVCVVTAIPVYFAHVRYGGPPQPWLGRVVNQIASNQTALVLRTVFDVAEPITINSDLNNLRDEGPAEVCAFPWSIDWVGKTVYVLPMHGPVGLALPLYNMCNNLSLLLEASCT